MHVYIVYVYVYILKYDVFVWVLCMYMLLQITIWFRLLRFVILKNIIQNDSGTSYQTRSSKFRIKLNFND